MSAADTPQPQHRADELAATVRDCLMYRDGAANRALSELVALAHAGDRLHIFVLQANETRERAERAEAEAERLRGIVDVARAWAEAESSEEYSERLRALRAALAGGQADKEPTT